MMKNVWILWLGILCGVLILYVENLPARMFTFRFASNQYSGVPVLRIEKILDGVNLVGRVKMNKSKVERKVTNYVNNNSKVYSDREIIYEQETPCWQSSQIVQKMHTVIPKFINRNVLDKVAIATARQIVPYFPKMKCKIGISFRTKCSKRFGNCEKVRSHSIFLKTSEE